MSTTFAYRDRDMYGGIGVHGWRGRWLVNGAVSGIATLEIDPPARASVLGGSCTPGAQMVLDVGHTTYVPASSEAGFADVV